MCRLAADVRLHDGRHDLTLSPTPSTTIMPTIQITSSTPCDSDGCSNYTTPSLLLTPAPINDGRPNDNATYPPTSIITALPTVSTSMNDTDDKNASSLSPTPTPININRTIDGRNGSTLSPTLPTNIPTTIPIAPTFNHDFDTNFPSTEPTIYPTNNPSTEPTIQTTINPTKSPTVIPTFNPIPAPTPLVTALSTTEHRSTHPTDIPTAAHISTMMDETLSAGKQINEAIIQSVIITLAVIICCCVVMVVLFKFYKKHKGKEEKDFENTDDDVILMTSDNKSVKNERQNAEMRSTQCEEDMDVFNENDDDNNDVLLYAKPIYNTKDAATSVEELDEDITAIDVALSGHIRLTAIEQVVDQIDLDNDVDDNDDDGEVEDALLYKKPTSSTKSGASTGQSVEVVHFYYMDFVDQKDNEHEDKDANSELYHEKQQWEMCLMHALNALLQKQQFTAKNMNDICKELAPNKLINPHKSVLQTGNYDANVLMKALSKINIDVQWFDARKINQFDLEDDNFLKYLESDNKTFVGFILNSPQKAMLKMFTRRHWIAIKQINNIWYNLDSKLKQPKKYENAQELNTFLVDDLSKNNAEIMICRKENKLTQKKAEINVKINW